MFYLHRLFLLLIERSKYTRLSASRTPMPSPVPAASPMDFAVVSKIVMKMPSLPYPASAGKEEVQ
jgi:hypothetical protein